MTLTESMTKMEFGGWSIRIWRQEHTEPPFAASHTELKNAVWELRDNSCDIWTVARKVLDMDRVNAVEVMNTESEGMVIYKDWP